MIRILFWMIVFCAPVVGPATGEARLVRDQLGREVLVPDNPERVVSLAPSITEIVFALGEGHRLKGVTQHCDFPPEAESLPKIGSYVHPDLEKIVALKPDLCLGTRDGNPREVAERLEALKIPVYAVNPKDLDTVMDTLLEIGRLLHAEQRAQTLVKEMRAQDRRGESRGWPGPSSGRRFSFRSASFPSFRWERTPSLTSSSPRRGGATWPPAPPLTPAFPGNRSWRWNPRSSSSLP